jgi:hypothetical protein
MSLEGTWNDMERYGNCPVRKPKRFANVANLLGAGGVVRRGKKKEKGNMSIKLARPKVMEQIDKLPKTQRRLAIQRLESALPRRRHGSPEYARQHPSLAVTMKEKLEMVELHKRHGSQKGLSFRALEEVYHLIPNSGNDAQRCIRLATRHLRRQARRKATA